MYLHLLEMSKFHPEKFGLAMKDLSRSRSSYRALVRDIFRVKELVLKMRLPDALKLAQRTYQALKSHGLHELRAQMASYLGSIYLYLSNYELAETYFSEALELYEKYESILPKDLYLGYLYNYALTVARDGRFREASQNMEKIWKEMQSSRNTTEEYRKMFHLRVAVFMVRVAVYTIDFEKMETWKGLMDTLTKEINTLSINSPFEYRLVCGVQGIKGFVERFARGNLNQCAESGFELMRCASRHGIEPEFEYLRNAAESLVYLGREEEAQTVFQLAREKTRRNQNDIDSAYAREIMALEYRLNGNPEKAYKILREVSAWYEERGLILECLYARVVMEYTGRTLILNRGSAHNVDYIRQWLPVYPFLKRDPIYGMFVREVVKIKGSSSSDTPPKLRFWFLGEFRMELDGFLLGPKDWRRKKSLLALKYLILNRGRKVLMDELSFVLWPDETEEAAKTRLWVAISYLRKMLGAADEYLRTVDGAYVLEETPDIWVDVVEFERLVKRAMALADAAPDQGLALAQEALKLYKAELLPEDKFQTWLDEHRRYFHRLFIRVLLLTADLTHSISPRDSVKLLEEYAERWPMEEEIISELVSRLMLAGDETKAQAIYNNFKRILWNRHRMKPSFRITG